MKLTGKVTIITGGGTGIGKGIAKCFAEEGAKLILAQRRREVVEQTAKEVGAIAMVCDVSCKTQVQNLVDKTMKQFGRIDVLVNNAAITGMPAVTPFLKCSEEAWDKVLDVNLKGTFLCSPAAAQHMVVQRGGVIINISSVGAFAAQQQASAYCASKAGMEGLTKSMALELSPHGVRVVGIAPGDIVVEKNQQQSQEMTAIGIDRTFSRKTPLARRGLPEEIGTVAVFLASQDASFVQGSTWVVDGGFLVY